MPGRFGFPERTPLNASTVGTISRKGYRVEKVLFESELAALGVTHVLDLREPDERCGPGVFGSEALAGLAARGIARKNVPNAHFFCQDMTELDYPDESLDGICSYYAIIHIPREEHASLLANFHRMLRTGGVALLCLGAEDNVDDVDEFLGTSLYWSHYNSGTYLQMLKDCGFTIIWAKHIADETCAGAKHLFVLAQKESA